MSFYFLEATAFAKLFVREAGTDALIRLMERVEDNSKLISAATPLEVYAAIRRRERAGQIAPEDAATALELLRLESARMVQQPLNPAVLEAARQLLDRPQSDRGPLRWPAALQLGAALAARNMFQSTPIAFVSGAAALLEAAKTEGFETIDPVQMPIQTPREPAETAPELN
ncbi:MAG: type II toxin-antitoxin system VapC family toxin [Terracidiphilus sp.]